MEHTTVQPLRTALTWWEVSCAAVRTDMTRTMHVQVSTSAIKSNEHGQNMYNPDNSCTLSSTIPSTEKGYKLYKSQKLYVHVNPALIHQINFGLMNNIFLTSFYM